MRRSATTMPPRHFPLGSWWRNRSFFGRSPNSSRSGARIEAAGESDRE
ncbi:hypothetical protein PUR34_01060 [Streptomyces sp. JV185]|nr:hypothetical protein [Streptomyces sp. JV185]MEE1766845.1 hypothetical protein [Streptomyces sp. JV185]